MAGILFRGILVKATAHIKSQKAKYFKGPNTLHEYTEPSRIYKNGKRLIDIYRWQETCSYKTCSIVDEFVCVYHINNIE